MAASPESLEIAGEDGIRFAQITDCHLMDEPDGRLRGIHTRATLEAILESIGNNHPHLDFLLFTGDISQIGNRASYGVFASTLASLSCPIYCIPGNHDDPAGLHDIIFKPGAATLTVDETRTPGYRYFHIKPPHRVHTRVYHLAH